MVAITLDPLTRVNGSLRVSVELKDGYVSDSWCSGTSYRGLEQMLIGKDPMDAVYYTQRACGMCSIPHAIASVSTIENLCDASGSVPGAALVVRNILNGLSWLRNHIEHLYLCFLPDLADPMYKEMLKTSDVGNKLWVEFNKRFAMPGQGVTIGEAYLEAVRCIKLISQAEAILGGRSPHTPAIVPGGVTCRPTGSDIYNLKECYRGIMDFLQSRLPGPVSIEEWLRNTHDRDGDSEYIWNYVRNITLNDFSASSGWGDMQLFFTFCSRMVSRDYLSAPAGLDLDTIGGYSLYDQIIGFLSYGSFYKVRDAGGNIKDGYVPLDRENANSYVLQAGFTPGSMQNIYAAAEKIDTNLIVEHVHGSFYDYSESRTSRAPLNGETIPFTDPAGINYNGSKYSFVKAPRYGDVPCEAGPMARMINTREKLILDVMRTLHDSNSRVQKDRTYPMTGVYTRVLSRMQETLVVARMLEEWIYNDLEADVSKYCIPLEIKPRKTGAGLIEAPRGALGHWMRLDSYGKIAGYQIISPTTWNASPRGAKQKYGPMELALLGARTTPLGNIPGSETNPTSIYHIARSFDPCMNCAVHTIRNGR